MYRVWQDGDRKFDKGQKMWCEMPKNEKSVFNPRMHNRGQNDPDGATHVDCSEQIANILLDFPDFVSNL